VLVCRSLIGIGMDIARAPLGSLFFGTFSASKAWKALEQKPSVAMY
jgi:hypothetical protein